MGAVLSDDGVYRYALWRGFDTIADAKRPVVFALCNPSTADAEIDDATVRKCRGFTREWKREGFFIVNVFAFRSRHPSDLLKARDPVGPENLAHIDRIATIHGALVVVGWGLCLPRSLRHHTLRFVERATDSFRNTPMCFGVTDEGEQPRHPLMLSYSTPLVPFVS